MNKFIIFLLSLIFILIINPCQSTSLSVDLNSIEKHYFGREYTNNKTTQRLNRLEELLFGQIQQGSIDERESNILKIYEKNIVSSKTPKVSHPLSSIASPNNSSKDKTKITTDQKSEYKSAGSSQANQSQKSPGIKKYPKITFLESKILKKTYTYQTPELRLDRLENTVFGKANDKLSIDKRISLLNKVANPQIVDNLPNMQERHFFYTNPGPNSGSMPNNMMDLNNQFNMMFKQLEKQFDNFGNESLDGNDFNNFNQFTVPRINPPIRSLPNAPTPIIPPYNSPNSI